MAEYQKRPVQTEQESLHWISYNLKMLVAEMKAIGNTLDKIMGTLAGRKDIPF